MASSSSYFERKLKELNCMKGSRAMYSSLSSIDSVDMMPTVKKQKTKANLNSKKTKNRSTVHFSLFNSFGRKSASTGSDRFSVSYEHVPNEDEDLLPGKGQASERTRLLTESLPVFGKKHYSGLQAGGQKKKKNVNLWGIEPIDGLTEDSVGPKKKRSLLKRTGKLIVRTCRLMTYSAPYMTHMGADYPYNTRCPPDYRYYDFEKKEWDYGGYSSNYMGAGGMGPSVFF